MHSGLNLFYAQVLIAKTRTASSHTEEQTAAKRVKLFAENLHVTDNETGRLIAIPAVDLQEKWQRSSWKEK